MTMYTRRMRFTKMHGIGNDYVYVDATQDSKLDFARAAALVSDRHFAVGSDGLIAVCAPTSRDADVRMRMFNADGSEGEMCGNGIRCVAKFAVDHGISSTNPLRIETGRGVLEVEWTRANDGKVAKASVQMGAPILEHAAIPARLDDVGPHARVVAHAIDLARFGATGWWKDAGVEAHMTLVSMGNPHAIFCCADPSKVPLELVGPRIEHDPWFPSRINAHFVHFAPDGRNAIMRTWERGSGITLACGTGASAVCVAGVLLQRGGRVLDAQLPGGWLRLEWPTADASVRMTGAATEVFEGEVDLEALAMRATATSAANQAGAHV